MNEEFSTTAMNTVTSTKGFTVEVKFAGGVEYRDSNTEAHLDSEWLAKPPGILLYRTSPGNRGFDKLQQPHADIIFDNIVRALKYLGHRVEIWNRSQT
jgi:hypothetical protein